MVHLGVEGGRRSRGATWTWQPPLENPVLDIHRKLWYDYMGGRKRWHDGEVQATSPREIPGPPNRAARKRTGEQFVGHKGHFKGSASIRIAKRAFALSQKVRHAKRS